MPEHSQSVSARSAASCTNAIDTSGGASALVRGNFDDEPTCMFTTVAVSSHASHNGAQKSVKMLGRSRSVGLSVKQIACAPLSAHRRTSLAASSASQSGTNVSGIKRL